MSINGPKTGPSPLTALGRWMPKVVVGVLIGVALRISLVAVSQASHPWGWEDFQTHKHLLSMTNLDWEQYCVVNIDGSLAPSEYLTRIRNTLEIEEPLRHWNGLGQLAEPKVSIRGDISSTVCSDSRTNIPVYIIDSTVCDPNESCVLHPEGWTEYNPVTVHYEYTRLVVHFRPEHIDDNDFYRHIISHEFGQVFGLGDGTGPGDCPASVMHNIYYGCSQDDPFPSLSDLQSAALHIPGSSGDPVRIPSGNPGGLPKI